MHYTLTLPAKDSKVSWGHLTSALHPPAALCRHPVLTIPLQHRTYSKSDFILSCFQTAVKTPVSAFDSCCASVLPARFLLILRVILCNLCSSGSNFFFLYIGGCLLIAGKFIGIFSPSSRHGTKVCTVAK